MTTDGPARKRPIFWLTLVLPLASAALINSAALAGPSEDQAGQVDTQEILSYEIESRSFKTTYGVRPDGIFLGRHFLAIEKAIEAFADEDELKIDERDLKNYEIAVSEDEKIIRIYFHSIFYEYTKNGFRYAVPITGINISYDFNRANGRIENRRMYR
jgi:hypothetical protein